jgi:ribosome-associated toxin RatA of RatAB toxin-antitoxin module
MFQAALIVIRILLGMALVGGGEAIAAAPPAVNFQQQGTHLLVSGELTVPVSPATAWAVLTDYERVPEFVPGMRVSRVLEQSGNTRVVEQQGEMQANNMRMLFMGTLRITEEPTSRLSVQFLSGTFRNMQGQWTLQGKRAPVTLAYQLDFDAGTPYPSPVMVGMLQQQVIHWVTSLAAEMERRPPPKPEPEPKKKRRKTP